VLGVRRSESGDWRGDFGRLGFIGVVFFIYLKNIYPADFALERVGFWIWLGRKVDSII
jgi:hypothetical protein